MKLKDFVKIVLFAVLGFVLLMGGGMISMLFGSFYLFAQCFFGTVLSGPVYATLLKKVPHRPTAFLFYVIAGLIFIVIGFGAFFFFMLLPAVVAELCHMGSGEYASDKKISISYILSQMVYGAHPIILFVILGDKGINRFFPGMFDEASMNTALNFFSQPKNCILVLLIQLVACVIGAKLGLMIYHKFFSKTRKGSKLDG